MKIGGKHNWTLDVLIPKWIEARIQKLVDMRDQCGISPSNVYLHPNRKDGYVDNFKILERAAQKCGLKYPERVKTCTLRSHMATSFLLYNSDDGDKEAVARSMGHRMDTHK